MAALKIPPRFTLFLLILLAFLLRLPNLGYSFYGDEMFSLVRDSNHLLTDSCDRARPLYFSLLFLWRTIGFDGEVGLRLLSVVFGVLSVPLAWTIGHRIGGRGFAIGYSLLLATSPLHVEFSQELRMYSLIALASFAQLACYMHYRESGRRSALVFGTLAGLVGMYSHPFYCFYLLGFALLALLDRHTIRLMPFGISLFAIALLYLPNVANFFWLQSTFDVGFFQLHLLSVLLKLAAAFSVGFNLFRLADLAQGRGIGWEILADNRLYVLLCILVFGLLLIGAIRGMTRSDGRFMLYSTTALLVFPALVMYGLEIATYKNVVMAKFSIFLLPQALLVFAWGFQKLRLRALQIGVGVAYGFLIIAALGHFYTDPVHYGRRSNWRAAAALVQERAGREVAVVLIRDWKYYLLDYYGIHSRPYWLLVDSPKNITDYAPYLREKLAGKREVYYLREDDVQNANDPDDLILKTLREMSAVESTIHYNPRFELYHFRLAASYVDS